MSVEERLRDGLAESAGNLDVAQGPWAGFAQRERAHRRTRRIRVAALSTVLAAAVGVQTNLVPLPGWAPGLAVAGVETALVNSPVRGSLATDTAWQAAMRDAVRDVEDPGQVWKADRDHIRFVFAGDVSDHRLALMLVPLRFGFLSSSSLIWYDGPAGAVPSAMTEGARGDTSAVETYSQGSSDGPGVAVVVAPAAATVSVSTGFRYGADGRIVHNPPIVGTGLVTMTLPAAPFNPGLTATVTQGGRTLYTGPVYGGWSGHDPDPQEASAATVTAALGDRSFDAATLTGWVSSALSDARLPAAGTAVRVRWTGTVNGDPAALFTLHPAGGGVLAYAMHGSAGSFREDLRVLLPVAGDASRPIAWRMRAEGRDDRTDQVHVVAPPGSAEARIVPAGGAPIPVALDADGAGTAALPPDAAATVQVRDARGATFAAPVIPFETDSGGIPGDTPKTRIVS
jgi:hypothetical protein